MFLEGLPFLTLIGLQPIALERVSLAFFLVHFFVGVVLLTVAVVASVLTVVVFVCDCSKTSVVAFNVPVVIIVGLASSYITSTLLVVLLGDW